MADDSDVSVRFGADTAPLEDGAAASAAAVDGFGDSVASISAAIAAQTEEMTAGFAQLGETITAAMAEANPITQLHAQEMALPASIAGPLRGMISNGGGQGGATGGGKSSGGRPINLAVNSLNSRDTRKTLGTPAGRAMIRQMVAEHG